MNCQCFTEAFTGITGHPNSYAILHASDLITFREEIQNPNEVVPGSPDVQSDQKEIEIP